jgi:sugar O-acyltransferase (sialic acid O-acetyltransferase NeuD family)
MSEAERILVPLLNPNEPEARLVDLRVSEGQQVKSGELLGTLETTKSTFELTAESDGFIVGIGADQDEMLRAGETFCYLAESADWKAPKKTKKKKADKSDGLPEGLRITQPALQVAQSEGLDLSTLPVGPVVTEEQVRKALSKAGKVAEIIIPPEAAEKNSIVVYGGGGHGKAVIELIRAVGGYTLIGVIDDGLETGNFVLDVPVLGDGARALPALNEAGCKLAINAVGGIGAISSRIQVFERLKEAGFSSPALVHPSAVIEPSALLSPGVQVFPHAYVGSSSKIEQGVIINTGVIVSHDCELAEYVNLAPGAILAGGVQVGEGTLLGMGVTINLGVSIGPRARIGNSATIKDDVPAKGIVRAGSVWPQ